MKTTLIVIAAVVAVAVGKEMPPIPSAWHGVGSSKVDPSQRFEFAEDGDKFYSFADKDDTIAHIWGDYAEGTSIAYLENEEMQMCEDFGEPWSRAGFFPYQSEPILLREDVDCVTTTCDCWGNYLDPEDPDEDNVMYTCIDASHTEYALPIFVGAKMGKITVRVMECDTFELGTGPEENWVACEPEF